MLVIATLACGSVLGAGTRCVLVRIRFPPAPRAGCCELATAAGLAVVAVRWSTGHLPLAWVPVPSALTVLAVALGTTDLMQRRLPNVLTYAGYPVLATALAPWVLTGDTGVTVAGALIGGCAFGGAHLAIHLIRPRSLGAGDVKLAGALGAVLGVLGAPAVLLAAIVAAVVTLALSVGAASSGRRRWRDGVPYGPGLVVATWLLSVTPEAGLVT